MIKKILIGLLVFFVLLISAAIVLPIVFKDDIFALVEEEANNNLNATVEFGDIGLTLFESFPDFTLTVDDIKVTGQGVFQGGEIG